MYLIHSLLAFSYVAVTTTIWLQFDFLIRKWWSCLSFDHDSTRQFLVESRGACYEDARRSIMFYCTFWGNAMLLCKLDIPFLEHLKYNLQSCIRWNNLLFCGSQETQRSIRDLWLQWGCALG